MSAPGAARTPGPDIDARGWRCPLPVIALARRAAQAPDGSRIVVWADDPAARSDIPAWARMKGHHVRIVTGEDYLRYEVDLGQDAPPKSS